MTVFNLRPHRREDFITKIAAASLEGDCPTWLKFLEQSTGGDRDLQLYLQRCAGYWLTGITREQVMWFIYGPGNTGKSLFVRTIAGVMGDYAKAAPMDLLTEAQGERHPTELAGLRSVRLVTLAETEEGRRWAESRIKALTGGDRISARFMRGDFFEFDPQFKIVVHGNHRPRLRNPDEAMRRRMHVVPFNHIVPEADRDKDLPEKLKAEWGGILRWMLFGCRDWQRSGGLNPPPAVTGATDNYFLEEDALGRWIEECCITGKEIPATRSLFLFESWKAWCEANGEQPGSNKRFSQALDQRGHEIDRNSVGQKTLRGIGVR